MSKQDITTIMNEHEYAEILQRAVLEIHTARTSRNLWDMKRFYERYYQADTKLRQAVAVLPWRHNLVLINKVKEDNHTEFYANEVVAKGWSRDLLLNAIKMDTYTQTQKQIKSNNFDINS